jgi:GntR family transcriptional repressor for pyruvate dehydrogenase complex
MSISGTRKTLSDAVAEDLLRQIREGKYGIGDRLPILQELMAEYRVGYGVAREAMQQLVALGIADVRPKRGAVVLQVDASSALDDATLAILLSGQAIEELYELRRLIEVATVGQAAQRNTPEKIAKIREAQLRFEQESSTGEAPKAADVGLHAVIAQVSGNTVFVKVLDSLREVLSGVRAQVVACPGAVESARIEHAAVVDAIALGDVEGARQAMEKHIDTATQVLLRARAANAVQLRSEG